MCKGLIISNILEFIRGREKVEHSEIESFINSIYNKRGIKQIYTSEINDTIFDLIVDGILKIGIVYSYGGTSSQYFVDEEKLMERICLCNKTAC